MVYQIGGLISSTSSGISELVAAQEGNAGQTLTLHALGNGLNINLASNVDIDAFTSLAQSGGNSGQNTAEANDSVGTSEIIPQSTIGLEIVGADNIALELDSHATGWEQVSSAAEQEAQVINQQGAGWGVPSGGWGASLQSGRK